MQSLGVTDDSALGVAARSLKVVHARARDAAEPLEKRGMHGFEAARRAVSASTLGRRIAERPLRSALVALGAGVLAAGIVTGVRRSGQRRVGV